MMRLASSIIALVSLLSFEACAAELFEWETASPESQGMSTAKLDALKEVLAAHRTRAFLVVRNDRIVYEWYADGTAATSKQGTASLAKAIVGGMSLAVALTDGKLGLDDPVSKWVPQWRDDPQKSRITIRQLGSHTSGLEDSSVSGVTHTEEPGWKGEFWKRLDPPRDPFTISRDDDPVEFPPGERLQYSNPGIAMLTYAVTSSLRDAPQKDIRTLLRERIMRPIGARDADWSVGYGKTFTVDALPLVGAWGGGAFTPRTTARIGRLVLHAGDWDGTRLLSEKAVELVTRDAGLPGNCGMGWWTNGGARYPWLPADAVWGAGAGDQLLLVIPSLSLVMVRNGQTLLPEDENETDVFARYHDGRAKLLFKPLVEAITANEERQSAVPPSRKEPTAPYPPSAVITGIDWAPANAIVRAARGSDNWPLTWADDENLYGAYGDGNGFVPFVERKLSLGLVRITGGPDSYVGFNLRTPDMELLGDGAQGRKASGLLMVAGVLYLWARNAGNAQLAWSGDHGKSWTWADWKWMTSFGCPTFLNFGPDYAGARDDHVYVYSPDSDNAYEAADRMVLARVPKDGIRDRTSYQFFQSLGSERRSVWSRDIAERGAVFVHPGRCYRGGITYNEGLKRYLWCQVLPESTDPRGPRFQGGFGVYDAPEPWGPWTTAFFTNAWDVGPGETSSLPTKWMSEDGRTVNLVFSGNDQFSVRRGTLRVADAAGQR